jgi:hypothetical protein
MMDDGWMDGWRMDPKFTFLKLDVTLSKKGFDSIKDILDAWFIVRFFC